MMRVLVLRSIRDSALLLCSCCALLAGFVCLRVWIASKIKYDAFIKLFSEGLKIFQNLLPVSIEDLASPLGRAAFSYEELPTILLMGLWTVTRGSDCLVGRVGSGTMEMLLAQPLRRLTLVTSHSLVTLLGVFVLAAMSLIGLRIGISISQFEEPPELRALWPGAVNYIGMGVFLVGLSTLASALARTRATAVAVVIGFYVVELALMILGRLSPDAEWVEWLTILSAYEPTRLVLELSRDAPGASALFWQLNACLVGLGAATWLVATTLFCRRDVPAPL